MDDIYENIEEYNLSKERKILTVFGEMIVDILSPDIHFKDLINFLQKRTAKPCSFLVIDTTFVSDNCLRFRQMFWERLWQLMMATDVKIRDEKLWYNINREAAEIISSIIIR